MANDKGEQYKKPKSFATGNKISLQNYQGLEQFEKIDVQTFDKQTC